jgi:hypothetical protein
MKVKPDRRRTIRAGLRDTRVLFHEFRNSLIFFVIIFVSSTLFFRFLYTFPDTGEHPHLGKALHATFAMIFFEFDLPLPEQWYLQIPF